jgi:hypothetical protein
MASRLLGRLGGGDITIPSPAAQINLMGDSLVAFMMVQINE